MIKRQVPSDWKIGTTRDYSDTLSIRYALNCEVDPSTKAAVVFLNGRTEWIEKNCDLAADLVLPEGTVFLTLDHRGQGGSGGHRSYVESYDEYAKDIAKLISETIGELPYALVCHSMGSLIGIYGTLTRILTPRAIVCSAPLLALPPEPIPHIIARPAATLLSLLGLKTQSTGAGHHERATFENNILTHSHSMFDVIQNSPYRIPGATFGWVKATFAALDLVHNPNHLATLSAPTRILSPSEERVVDPTGSARWIKTANEVAPVPTQLDIIHGGRHELFSEIDKYRSMAVNMTKEWLERHFYV